MPSNWPEKPLQLPRTLKPGATETGGTSLDAKVSFISRKVAFDLYGQVELSMGCSGGLQDDDALKLALQAPMNYQVKHGCSDIDVLAHVLMDAIVENQPFSKWNFEFACLAATKFKALNTF